MSDTVYVVVSGDYSGYGIRAVFLDEGLANEHVAALVANGHHWNEDARVEEWPVGAGTFTSTFFRVKGLLGLDGSVRTDPWNCTLRKPIVQIEPHQRGDRPVVEDQGFWRPFFKRGEDAGYVMVEGPVYEEAVKVALDCLYQMKDEIKDELP